MQTDAEKQREIETRLQQLGLLESKLNFEENLRQTLQEKIIGADDLTNIIKKVRRRRENSTSLEAISDIRNIIRPKFIYDDKGNKAVYEIKVLLGRFTHDVSVERVFRTVTISSYAHIINRNINTDAAHQSTSPPVNDLYPVTTNNNVDENNNVGEASNSRITDNNINKKGLYYDCNSSSRVSVTSLNKTEDVRIHRQLNACDYRESDCPRDTNDKNDKVPSNRSKTRSKLNNENNNDIGDIFKDRVYKRFDSISNYDKLSNISLNSYHINQINAGNLNGEVLTNELYSNCNNQIANAKNHYELLNNNPYSNCNNRITSTNSQDKVSASKPHSNRIANMNNVNDHAAYQRSDRLSKKLIIELPSFVDVTSILISHSHGSVSITSRILG